MTTKTKSKTVKMTDLERNLLESVWTCNFHDGCFPVEHPVWTNIVTETLGKSAQGAITSARKKGWVRIQGDTTEDRVIAITLDGAKRLAETNPAVAFQIEEHKKQNARDVAAAVGPAVTEPKSVKLTSVQIQRIRDARTNLLAICAAMQELNLDDATVSPDFSDSLADWESDAKNAAEGLGIVADQLTRNI